MQHRWFRIKQRYALCRCQSHEPKSFLKLHSTNCMSGVFFVTKDENRHIPFSDNLLVQKPLQNSFGFREPFAIGYIDDKRHCIYRAIETMCP
jgi:hypothetical protein